MAGRLGAGRLMAGAALTLPLWLGCSAPASTPAVGTSGPAGATKADRAAPAEAPLLPAPRPQAPPASTTPPAGTAAPSPGPPAAAEGAAPGTAARLPATAPGVDAAEYGADASAGVSPSPSPRAPASASHAPPDGGAAGTLAVTAYYVLIDDGGAKGVRFGCNDSLVGIRRTGAGSGDPLPAAMRALLEGSPPPAPGLYNSLSGSTLTFLAGSYDGLTVTVYLAGAIRPGGTCDIPRIEAQLTQTAVASVGALRAEIYVNGVRLSEALSQG